MTLLKPDFRYLVDTFDYNPEDYEGILLIYGKFK